MEDGIITEIRKRNLLHTNIDLDGFLSTALITKAFPETKYNVVGFNSSNDKIYYLKDKSLIKIDDLIYVDYYVIRRQNRQFVCLDQHVIDFIDINNDPLMFNPNRDFGITQKTFTQKFPYSTFIYLLYSFEKNNIVFNDIDLNCVIKNEMTLLDLIYRGDGILRCFNMYMSNAIDWIERMKKDLPENSLCKKIFDMLYIDGTNLIDVETRFANIESTLKDNYSTTTTHNEGYVAINNGMFSLMSDIYKVFNIQINFGKKSEYKQEIILPYTCSEKGYFNRIINDDKIINSVFTNYERLNFQAMKRNKEHFEKTYGRNIKLRK
jgi:hypothetical protein